MSLHSVSPRVSSTREDGPDLVKPWTDKAANPTPDLFGS
jgi:hypothetical protein